MTTAKDFAAEVNPETRAVNALLEIYRDVPDDRLDSRFGTQNIRQRAEAWIARAMEELGEEFDVEAG